MPKSLKQRFHSVEIEELEFHRRVQGEESLEQLGMDLHKLGRKAFPSIEGKEFNCMLKDRFYQAIHPKWQRKLNAPQPEETFAQLFERARMLEQHEKQFSASAACRRETTGKKNKPATSASHSSTSLKRNKLSEPPTTQVSSQKVNRYCYDCLQPGHLARNCPGHLQDNKQEGPGRSTCGVSCTSCLEVKETQELTEEGLELLLAHC